MRVLSFFPLQGHIVAPLLLLPLFGPVTDAILLHRAGSVSVVVMVCESLQPGPSSAVADLGDYQILFIYCIEVGSLDPAHSLALSFGEGAVCVC